jgi:predicted permease
MTRLRILLSRIVALFQKNKLEEELDDELCSHIEMEAEENIRRGMGSAEARASAVRKFGGFDRTKEHYRDLRGIPALESIIQDLRYSVRTLCKNPGFTLTAIVSIALAIGANSAIFSFADGLLLRPLPVEKPWEVVVLRLLTPGRDFLMGDEGMLSYAEFRDFSGDNRSFAGWAVYSQVRAGLASAPGEQAQMVSGYLVNSDFFRVLGIEPPLGRGFNADESEIPGRDAVAILSHEFWTNKFSADASVLGRKVWINGLQFSVIGVAPELFTGMGPWSRPDFFVPAMMGPKILKSETLLTDRTNRAFTVKGRLKPGASLQAAAEEASVKAETLAQTYPASNRNMGATVSTELRFRLADEPGLGLLVSTLFGTVMTILLIACANVANLMLSRGRTRTREIAVRLAIGAGRQRLTRLLLAESLLIAFASGLLALFVTYAAIEFFSTFRPPTDIPLNFDFELDARVLWFTALVSLTSALLFGLVPAIRSTRVNLVSDLKAGTSEHERGRAFGRTALVVIQVAGSLLLLQVATQGDWAFRSALATHPGFRKDHTLTMRLDPTIVGYTPAQAQRFYELLLLRTQSIPGVRSAALTSALPMTGRAGLQPVIPENYELRPGEESVGAGSFTVDDNFFETFGVPMVAGRGFSAADHSDSPRVAVVNRVFAQRYLGANPLGKRVQLNDRNGPWTEIVGVTVTGMFSSPIEPQFPVIYLPLRQNPREELTLIAHTRGDPAMETDGLRDIVRSIDPSLPVFRVATMEEVFESGFVNLIRIVGRLQSCASVLGLILAFVGLYAVLSYQVAQRTREIGIRIALGAQRREVILIFLKRAFAMGIVGICIGQSLSFVSGEGMQAVVGLPEPDLMLGGFVILGMLLTLLCAAGIPARRASRIDPQIALRQE